MHALDRSRVPAPTCLGRFRHGADRWGDLTSADKAEVWQALDAMQGRLCAYCEAGLNVHRRHIEHFRDRDRHPQGTFDWANLLGNCDRLESCGHHKDSKAGRYDPADLVDPTREDPDHFFRFGADGTITLRPRLSEPERHRASETLRVLNLDPEFGKLREMRQQAVRAYLSTDPNIIEELYSSPPDFRREYVRAELARTVGDPFCTVIRHFFEGLD